MNLPTLTIPSIPCRKKPDTSIVLCTVILRLGCGNVPGEGPEYLRWEPSDMGQNGVTPIDDVTMADVLTAAASTAVDQKYNGRSIGYTVQLQSGIDDCKLMFLCEGIEDPDVQDKRVIIPFADRVGQSVATVHAEFYFYTSLNGQRQDLYVDVIPEATFKRQNRSAYSASQTTPTVDIMLTGMPVDELGTRMIREQLNCTL
jgi:hypothetical protein